MRPADPPQLFIVPGPDAPPSGGNRYNEGLLSELIGRAGAAAFVRLAPEDLGRVDFGAQRGTIWLDSLYLGLAPKLRAQARAATPLRLLAHSLPTELARAAGMPAGGLMDDECAALSALQAAVAPSRTMALWLRARRPTLPVQVVAPAVLGAPPVSRDCPHLIALLVANLVPNKGVLPFLRELRRQVEPGERIELRCIGRRDADLAYARACEAELAAAPELAASICWLGPQPFAAVLAELGRAHVLVSPSRVESFGMAIAEARASGCAVIARRGGHVAELVAPANGGRLVDDDRALVAELLTLARDPEERARRMASAAAERLPERTWSTVADEFSALSFR